MGFIKGQQLLYMGPVVWVLADFVENDEGWAKIRFPADESEATVRPSHVRPLNERTMSLLLAEYAHAILGGDTLRSSNLRLTVDRVADAIRYPHQHLIDDLHAKETRSVQG